MSRRYFVYILKCADQSYYTGVTNNLERRLAEHKTGFNKVSYTYNHRPVELVFYEEFDDPELAIDYEKKIKGWSRKKKRALIGGDWEMLKELSVCRNKTSHKLYRKKK